MTLRSCTIYGNQGDGISLASGSIGSTTEFSSDLFDNGGKNVVFTSGNLLNAEYNYWGSTDVPTIQSKLSGNIDFEPFLLEQRFRTLDIQTQMPQSSFSVKAQDPVQVTVMLHDDLSNPVFANALDICEVRVSTGGSAIRLYDDGAHGDGASNDGRYGNTWVPSTLGATTLYFVARGNNYGTEASSISGTVNTQNQSPTAAIDNISPNPTVAGRLINFVGHGTDGDGSISAYEWRSNSDGLLNSQASFGTSSLSIGQHTISFRVKDDSGAWSPEVTRSVRIYPASNCIDVTGTILATADNIVESPPLRYSLTGNVTINGILKLDGSVVVDKRVQLAQPEVSGNGAISADDIQGTDQRLYAGGGSYNYYAIDNHLRAHDASGLLRGDFQVFGFNVNLGDFLVDAGGDYVETNYTVDLPYPIDKVMEHLADENPGNFPLYFDQVSFGRTYSRSNGISTHGDIGPLGVDMGVWAIYDVNVYWNQQQSLYGGGFTVKIPGRLELGSNKSALDSLSQYLEAATDLESLPVEIRDSMDRSIGLTDFRGLLEATSSGVFLNGFGVQIEFVPGGINKLIVHLEGSIPIGATGLRITEMNGGVEDVQTQLKVRASVNIETLLPEFPVIGPLISFEDFGIVARPFSYLRGEGTFKVCSYDVAGGFLEFDGTKNRASMAAGGYLNLADLMIGDIKVSLSGSGFNGSGLVTVKTPNDLPRLFDFVENQVITQGRLAIDNESFATQVQWKGVSLAQKILFGNPSFPGFHYYIGFNLEHMLKVFKTSKSNRQVIEYLVPENCPQMIVVSGNESHLFDFSIQSPSGKVYDSTDIGYHRFESSLQTILIVDLPEPGTWQFETEEIGEIEMDALGANQLPAMMFELPTSKKSDSKTIAIDVGDYNDTLDVTVYWDIDNDGFDGNEIAGFDVLNNASVSFDWNTSGLPSGEYYFYCRLDDRHNAPILQYAPGSIWVENFPETEIPQDLIAVQESDSVRVSWTPPVSTSNAGINLLIREVNSTGSFNIASLNSEFAYIYDLEFGRSYEISAAFFDTAGNLGQRCGATLLSFTSDTLNNPPWFTMNPDSTWRFVLGEESEYLLSAVDVDDDPIIFSGTNLPLGAIIHDSHFNWTPVGDSLAGYHSFALIANDGNGGFDTLRWHAVVYRPEEAEIRVKFSSPNYYENDNKYVFVSNMLIPDSHLVVTITNLRNNVQATLACYRADEFKYIGDLTLSVNGNSILPVDHGDSLVASYDYGSKTYFARCRIDSTQQPSDHVPPAAITDLRFTKIPGDSIRMYWTAPGDDSLSGRALYYDMRYSPTPIMTEQQFLVANKFEDVPYPSASGSMDSTAVAINSLGAELGSNIVYFAVKSEDDMQNRSSLSNLLTVVRFLCGDADNSEMLSISDAVYLINYIFAGGPAPNPQLSGDADCSGVVTISDVVYLINYIFAGGPAPCAACP